MADSPRKRYVRSPSPWEENSRSRSRSRSKSRSRSRSWSRPRERSRSRSRSRGRGTGREEVVNDGTTLYVTGLSTRVTEKELEDHFSKEGKVKSVFLVVEPRSRVSRGFAFVNMVTSDDANRCIKHLNQSVLEGRYITVERVFWLYSEDIASAMLAEIKDDQSIHRNKLKQLNSIYIAPTTLQPQRILNSQLIKRFCQHCNQAFMSRRKRARTPTPGHYLGLKSSRGDGYGDRGRYRGGSSREDYGYRRSPRRSPYRGGRDYSPRGGRDYSPRHSPYGGSGRSRRERSRSYSPPRHSPERNYARGSR